MPGLTIKYEGGRWKAVFRLRLADGAKRLRNPGEPVRHHGGAVGVDLGLKHLATLDRPVPGLTDEHGHAPNPRVLERHLGRLRRLDACWCLSTVPLRWRLISRNDQEVQMHERRVVAVGDGVANTQAVRLADG